MGSRKITLLLIAALVAIGTVFAVHSMIATAPAPVETPVIQTTEIAAASRDLPTGTILKEADFKWVQWPNDSDTSALFVKGKTNLTDLAGAVVRDGFRNGEPITLGHIAQPHDQGFLAAVLTPGMRAMDLEMRLHSTGQRVPFINAAVHAVLFYVSWFFPPIFLVSLVDSEKRCLHDILAEVVVVRRL